MKKTKRETRSPLKSAPLRNPGQSIEDEIHRIQHQALDRLVIVMVMGFFTLMEWHKWFFEAPPHPVIFTVLTGAFIVYFVHYAIGTRRRLRRLRQGRDGEKAVGQYLDELRSKGYRVLHDIVGDGFNIDHVLIGPTGIFTVETKTISKPAKGKPEIIYDGQQIKVGGYTPDRDPITQSQAQSRWLRELVQESTGHAFNVQALVLYPGWFITVSGSAQKFPARVMNPKMLPGFLDRAPQKLHQEDVQLVTYHLSRYIRTAI